MNATDDRVDQARRVRHNDIIKALALASIPTAIVFFLLWIGPALEPSDDDRARTEAISQLHELGAGDFVLTYNRLHARLKENLTYAQALPLLQRLQAPFATARIEKIAITNERADADVFCTMIENGAKHRMLLKQEHFSGLTRITDGHIESLMSDTNMKTIGDVLIDGKSVFADLSRVPSP